MRPVGFPLVVLFAALALIALSGCGDGSTTEADADAVSTGVANVGEREDVPEPTREKMRAAARDLMGSLKSRLVRELQAGGPASAVTVCSEVAQKIADKHTTPEMSVRRVSLKVRNPKDQPDAWERERLEELHQMHDRGRLPDEQFFVVEQSGTRRARYLKPIEIQKPCLSCHGPRDQLSEEVKRRLGELYPDDEATGYELGDLRGAVSVTASLP